MKKLAVIALGVFASVGVYAQTEAFNASVTPEMAVQSKSTKIEGVTLSIWGENPQKALSLGIVNGSTGSSQGFSWGLGLNYCDDYKGVQWALCNYAKGDFVGWQGAAVNYTVGDVKGLQTAWVNIAGGMTGLQFGLLNIAERVDSGVQIGLVNIIPQNTEWFSKLPEEVAPGMIFVNWRF